MALTEEEKVMFKAYNIGYLLSQHEPVLLDKIIRQNKNNEFVKMMSVGREHHHIHVNMPRKHSIEFKNGFYNGRTLAEHQPGMIGRLFTDKKLPKDYKKGLEAAEKEFIIKSIGKKIDAMPKVPPKELRRDLDYRKGFNVGYRLSENYRYALNSPQAVHERYSKFMDGIKSGREQFESDRAKSMEKDSKEKTLHEDPQKSAYKDALFEQKAASMRDVAQEQLAAMNNNEAFNDVELPKWMQEKSGKDVNQPAKNKDKDKDIDLDR